MPVKFSLNLKKIGFYLLFAVLGYYTFRILQPYISLLLLAFICTIVFDPIYRWMLQKTKSQGMATAMATISVLMAIILPLTIVVLISIGQALSLAETIEQEVTNGSFQLENIEKFGNDIMRWDFVERISNSLPDNFQIKNLLNSESLQEDLTSLATNTASFITTNIIPLAQNGAGIILNLTIFVMLLVYLFPERQRYMRKMIELSPLDDDDDRKFIRRFEVITSSLLRGTFIVALTQGILGGIIFWLLGIPASIFWAMIMTVVSLFPIGNAIVWVPASIILLIMGSWIQGIILLLYGTLVISTSDNIVRAQILKGGEAHMPPLLTLLGVLGGVQLFGFLGVIYGPLIIALFLTAVRLYTERKQQKKEHRLRNIVSRLVPHTLRVPTKEPQKTTHKTSIKPKTDRPFLPRLKKN